MRGGELLSRAGVIFVLPPLSPFSPPPPPYSSCFPRPSFPPFRPASLSTIRYISAHPRHCFRGNSSELFARDSFRVMTRRLNSPFHDAFFHSVVDRTVAKLARNRLRIQITMISRNRLNLYYFLYIYISIVKNEFV